MDLPFVTGDLPGTGGVLRQVDADFEVEEIPAYEPCGAGDHVYAWIEKRGVTTLAAVDRLAAALGVAARDVGFAGMKDRHAVTRQYVSFPPPVTPDAVRAVEVAGVRVLRVERHGNKLKTGHLRGNRFAVRIRGAVPDAAARAEAILARLADAPGSPNWFGEQRFGARGDNHDIGRALVRGEAGARAPRGRKRRLFVSAFQSYLFNDYLRRRIADGLYRERIDGDLMRRGLPSGPMFGHKMPVPAPGTAAAARERAVLDAAGVTLDDFRRAGKLAEGTRRPIAVPIDGARVDVDADGAVCVCFSLPAGAYATAVLREIVKPPAVPPRADPESP